MGPKPEVATAGCLLCPGGVDIVCRALGESAAARRYRPSSCHGTAGSDGTRRCKTRGRATVMGFGAGFTAGKLANFGGFGFGSRRLSNFRCALSSRASAASLTASTSSIVRQRFENRNTLTRRGPGSISIRPRWSSSFSDTEMFCRPM